MDNKESKPLVGRKFTNTEVNYYSSPIEAYGAKLTQSKYINIKEPSSTFNNKMSKNQP